jgi:hypothetical protein
LIAGPIMAAIVLERKKKKRSNRITSHKEWNYLVPHMRGTFFIQETTRSTLFKFLTEKKGFEEYCALRYFLYATQGWGQNLQYR